MKSTFPILLLALFPCFAGAEPVTLAEAGKATLPITISLHADPKTEALASELASGLQRITGAEFKVTRSANAEGIVLGTTEEWPGNLPPPEPELSSKLSREDYLLRSGEKRLLIVGRTPLAIQNGIWDLLYRIGFRHFFPGPTWEVWPTKTALTVDVDAVEKPDYFTRFTNLGAITWAENRPFVDEWKRRNRMESGFTLATGHVYQRIISTQKDFFESHPEALTNSTDHTKIDARSPGVLEAIDRFVLQEMSKQPDRDSISMEPSDKAGWSTDDPQRSPTDQAIEIANRAAETVRKQYPGTKIGMHAYNFHASPPSIPVDHDVIITVATSFIKGGYNAEGLLRDWGNKGIQTGVREYLSFGAAGHCLPGKTRAIDLDYITSTIPKFHQLGARYWKTEAADAWGIYGFGYFLTSRVLWDVREAEQKEAILQDFYDRAFGAAAPAIKPFFEQCIFQSGRPMLSEDLIARMYRHLEKALQTSDSPEVTARIYDLIVYTRYVDLMFDYQNAPADQKERAYLEVVKLAHGNYSTFMFDRYTIFREIPSRAFKIPKKELMPWMKDALDQASRLTPDETTQILHTGIASHTPFPFEPISFSENLVPHPNPPRQAEGDRAFLLRGNSLAYLYSKAQNTSFKFTVKGGEVYKDRGSVEISLLSPEHPIPGEAVATAIVPVDDESHTIELTSPYRGLHHLEVSDGGGGTRLQWSEGQRITFPSSTERSVQAHAAVHDMIFYVPAGTATIAGYTDNKSGQLLDPSGTIQLDFKTLDGPGYFSAAVPKGMDNALWRIVKTSRRKLLLTVPPYFSTTPDGLLIPQETTPNGKTP